MVGGWEDTTGERAFEFGVKFGVERFDVRGGHTGRKLSAPHRAELEPDDAGADNGELGRHLVQRQRPGGGDDLRLVHLDALELRGSDVGEVEFERHRLEIQPEGVPRAEGDREDRAAADQDHQRRTPIGSW